MLGILKSGTRPTWYNTPTKFSVVRNLLQNTHVDKNYAYHINVTNSNIFRLHFRSHQGCTSEEYQQTLIPGSCRYRAQCKEMRCVLQFPNRQNNSGLMSSKQAVTSCLFCFCLMKQSPLQMQSLSVKHFSCIEIVRELHIQDMVWPTAKTVSSAISLFAYSFNQCVCIFK